MTSSTDSLLALAWTTWVAVHKLKLATKHVCRLVHAEAASPRAQLCCELQEAWERRDHSPTCRPARKLGGKRNGPNKIFFNVPSSIRPSSSDWRSFLCGPRENGGCEGVEAKWPRSDQLELQRGPLATAPTPMKKTSESHHERTCKRKSPPSRAVLVDPERNLAYGASSTRPRHPGNKETDCDRS